MNLKKVGLFILFLLVGIILFYMLDFIARSLLTLLLFVVYITLLFFTIRKYSNNKLVALIILIIVTISVLLIPFPSCDSGSFAETMSTCDCIGIKKYDTSGYYDTGASQCIGIPINVREMTISDQMREQLQAQISDDFRSSDPYKKISFPYSKFVIKKEQNQETIFGVRNIKNIPLTFNIDTEVRKQDGQLDDSALFFEISSQNIVNSLESKILDLNIRASSKVDTYFVKLKIIDQEEPSLIYTEKQFFVQVIE